jgi:hypothetical protein
VLKKENIIDNLPTVSHAPLLLWEQVHVDNSS